MFCILTSLLLIKKLTISRKETLYMWKVINMDAIYDKYYEQVFKWAIKKANNKEDWIEFLRVDKINIMKLIWDTRDSVCIEAS